jgi:putative ABC transport system substrate-binding protein
MRRREFLGVLGGTAVAWPLAARAQQAIPVVGFCRSGPLATSTHLTTAFRRGLKEAGFIEGQNIAIEFSSANNQLDRLPALAAELARRPVAVIVGDAVVALAAKAATTTVPTLFVAGGDPVEVGLVTSLNRPGGNVTGVVFFSGNLGAKRLQLLRQIAPKATTIAMLVNPHRPDTEEERRNVQTAAQSIGQQLFVVDADSEPDIETAFATFVQRGAGALLIGSGVFMNTHRKSIVALAARYALPTSYPLREFVDEGGLMSYGASIINAYHQIGIYAARILKGEKPAELPVMQSDKIEFIINLKTAKTLGLEIHPQVLATADEVIE